MQSQSSTQPFMTFLIKVLNNPIPLFGTEPVSSVLTYWNALHRYVPLESGENFKNQATLISWYCKLEYVTLIPSDTFGTNAIIEQRTMCSSAGNKLVEHKIPLSGIVDGLLLSCPGQTATQGSVLSSRA
jgi:hypothetical protein